MKEVQRAIRNILVIQLRQIGDIVLTTPLLRLLRSTYPDARLTFLTEPPGAELLQGHPAVDEIVVYHRIRHRGFHNLLSYFREVLRMQREVRRRRFDLIIDLLGNPGTAIITLLSGSPVRVGLDTPFRRCAYTIIVPRIPNDRRYSALQKLDFLTSLGTDTSGVSVTTDLYPSDTAIATIERRLFECHIAPSDHLVLLCPTSPMPCRRWTPEGFARLGDLLTEQCSSRVVLTAAPDEVAYVEAVQSLMRTPTPIFSDLSLQEFAALCTKASVVVSNDSGAKHIAVAVGVSVVTIFGPTDEEVWNPSDRKRYPVVRVEIPCARCGLKRDCPNGMRCMEGVGVERVMKVVLPLPCANVSAVFSYRG